jgi:ubiquinone/menaquinone biosynthesis C-methylase UbiE
MLAERFRRVDAIDVSRTVIDEATRRHPEVEAACSDVRELPYEDGAFDAVVSTSTLDHFESVGELASGLRELNRVLAPGGALVVSIDNLANPLVAIRNALPYSWLHRIGLVPYYVGATCRPGDLRRQLARAGFEIQATTAIMHVPRVVVLAVGHGLDPMLACERLGAWPTRYLTGQFVAARAVKP